MPLPIPCLLRASDRASAKCPMGARTDSPGQSPNARSWPPRKAEPRRTLALWRRLRCGEGLAVDAGAVEAAGAALALGEHVAGAGDALAAGFGRLSGRDPLAPVAACDRGDVAPGGQGLRVGLQRLLQVLRHLRLGLLRQRRDHHLDVMAGFDSSGPA